MYLAIAYMLFGEALIIFAENYAAKLSGSQRDVMSYAILFLLAFVSGISLIFAYKEGYQHFDNIWVVVAISIGSIIVIEPIISWLMFHELPTHGAIAGIVLGIIGMILSVSWK